MEFRNYSETLLAAINIEIQRIGNQLRSVYPSRSPQSFLDGCSRREFPAFPCIREINEADCLRPRHFLPHQRVRVVMGSTSNSQNTHIDP
jgi:hypothetical protein